MNTFLIILGIIIALVIIVKFKNIIIPIAVLGGIGFGIYLIIRHWESIINALQVAAACFVFFLIIWLFNLEDPNGKKQ